MKNRKGRRRRALNRVDAQVSIFTAVLVVTVSAVLFFLCYTMTYRNMLDSLTSRAYSIHDFMESMLNEENFTQITTKEDMESALYGETHEILHQAKRAAGVRYLYTAGRNGSGQLVYMTDGLSQDAEDFRCPGDLIEPEIIPELERALAGEVILPGDIKGTDWGKIFITYFPIHDGARVVGALGIEFEADAQYETYRNLRIAAPLVALAACIMAVLFAIFFFRRISNPNYQDMANTDYLTRLKNRNAFNLDWKNLIARRDWDGLGVVLVDLDRLKQVNDTLGHEKGDEYLCLAAEAIRLTRGGMASYRAGGDEFHLLSRGVGEAELDGFCRRLEEQFTSLLPAWAEGLTLSVGWALYRPGRDEDGQAVYRRAEAMMYRQKKEHHLRPWPKDQESG